MALAHWPQESPRRVARGPPRWLGMPSGLGGMAALLGKVSPYNFHMTKLLHAFMLLMFLGCQSPSANGELVSQASAPSESAASEPDRVDLQARKVVNLSGVGEISDLAVVQLKGSPALLVAGTCGFAEVNYVDGSVLRKRPFALSCPPLLKSRIVDMDADGHLEFARFGFGWTGPTAVLDREGAVRWQDASPGACDSVVDLDGDGKSEILARESNSDVVRLLDADGHVRWTNSIPSPVCALVALDTDGDGRQEILGTDGERVLIYAADGSRLGSTEVPGGGYVGVLQIAALGTASGEPEIIVGVHVQRGSDKGDWFHRYARDAKRHLGRERTSMRAENTAEIPPAGGHGRLFLALSNDLRQAPGAGFNSSELALRVTGESGETLAESRFSGAGDEASMHGKLLVLDGSPARVLVGYGDGLWEVTLR